MVCHAVPIDYTESGGVASGKWRVCGWAGDGLVAWSDGQVTQGFHNQRLMIWLSSSPVSIRTRSFVADLSAFCIPTLVQTHLPKNA